MKSSGISVFGGVLFLIAAASAGIVPTLGEAGRYAVLSLSATEVNLNNKGAMIYGDIGVSGGCCLMLNKGAVYGDIYVDSAGMIDPLSLSSGKAAHVGQILYGQNLSTAVSDAVLAAQTAAAQNATQTFGRVGRSLTIYGNGGLNVIAMDRVDLGNKDVLTLSGTADDIFILNASVLQLGHRSSKIVCRGVEADRVLINVLDSALTLKGEINGTILAVGRNINLECQLNGAVIAGAVDMGQVAIGASVNGMVFVPEPSTLVMLVTGGLALSNKRMKIAWLSKKQGQITDKNILYVL